VLAEGKVRQMWANPSPAVVAETLFPKPAMRPEAIVVDITDLPAVVA